MYSHKSFISILFAVAALCCLMANATEPADFTCDILIGDATSEPSLTFGRGTALSKPFPPFSGQFGVKDFYLKNPAADDKTPEEMLRLGTDIRPDATSWQIACTNSNGIFYFSGDDLPALYYAYINPKDGISEVKGTITDGKLIVKGYTTVTISTAEISKAEAGDTSFLAKKDPDTKIYVTEGRTMKATIAEDSQSGDKFVDILLNAGTAAILVLFDGKYYRAGTAAGAGLDKLPDDFAGYICEFSTMFPLEYFNFADGTLTFKVTKGPVKSTPEGVEFNYTVSANKSGLPNMTATTDLDILLTIIERFGTLDFDGNGKVELKDAYFVYNFIYYKGHTGKTVTLTDMKKWSADPTDDEATTARETCLSDIDGLDFDNNGKVELKDAYFLYNFIYYKGHTGKTVTLTDMKKWSADPTDDEATTAREGFSSLVE